MKIIVMSALLTISMTTTISTYACYKNDSERCCNQRLACLGTGCMGAAIMGSKKVTECVINKNYNQFSWGESCIKTWFPTNSCGNTFNDSVEIVHTTNAWFDTACCAMAGIQIFLSACAPESCYKKTRKTLCCYPRENNAAVDMDYSPINNDSQDNRVILYPSN